jgi:hypothetical protein
MKIEHRLQEMIMDQEVTNLRSSQKLDEAWERSTQESTAIFGRAMRNATWKTVSNFGLTMTGLALPGLYHFREKLPMVREWQWWTKEGVDHASKFLTEAPKAVQPLFEVRDVQIQQAKDLLQHRETSLSNIQRSFTSAQERLVALMQQLNQVRNPLQ